MPSFFKKNYPRIAIAIFVFVSLFVGFFIFKPWPRRRFRAWWTSVCSRWLLKTLRVECKVSGVDSFPLGRGRLLVSNHLSYLDILLLSSLEPCLFVTSQETREEQPVGFISEMGGSLYVDRKQPTQMRAELREIAEALQRGFRVVVFPEATTGDGSTLLPFKRALFQAAVLAKAPVDVACIQYLKINGQELNSTNRDLIYYYGEMKFLEHFESLSQLDRVEASLCYLGSCESEDSRTLCDRAYEITELALRKTA